MIVLWAALATFKLVDIIKEISPWRIEAWVKSAWSLVIAGALSILFSPHAKPASLALWSFAAAGGSVLLHELQALLQAIGDTHRLSNMMTMNRSMPRERPRT